MLHRTMMQCPNFHSSRFTMTTAITSKSFKSAPTLEINATVRDLIAAMPIVLFFNAVRTAFSGSKTTVPASSTTAR
jgi:hypothetical protein